MVREKGLYRREGSSYWWIDVVLPDGSRVCQSTRLRCLSAANEFAVNLKADAYKRSREGIPYDKSWPEAVVRYLSENIDKKSLRDDKDHLRKLDPYLRDKRLREVKMEVLWPFIHQRREVDGVKPATINRALEVVRRILICARDEWEWLERASKIRMLRQPKRRVRFITRQEYECLLGELPEHLVPVVRFAVSTGCRMGEILRLEWSHVDFTRRVAWLDHGTTKNGEGRGIPLNNDAVIALRSVLHHHPKHCFTYKGKPMTEIGEAFKRALKRARIEDFRFHDLRHTWASWHVQNGTRLQELQELGGWKSFDMVLRYAHLAPEHLAEAAARIETSLETVQENSTFSLQ